MYDDINEALQQTEQTYTYPSLLEQLNNQWDDLRRHDYVVDSDDDS